jgi:hypothetical protein
MDHFAQRGLLDWDATLERWHPHNWGGRQFSSDDVTARVQRFRGKRNVSNTRSETLHETPLKPLARATDTDPETEAETMQTGMVSLPRREVYY